jgi:predicted DCC family thiol-disulfide oxidoreductase YuxK
MNPQPILIFDGVCKFCHWSVKFVMKRDKKKQVKFAALQSEEGQHLLKKHGFSTEEYDTAVLIIGEKVFTRSTASLEVCRYLSFPWPLMPCFKLVPKFLRDGFYNFIVRRRYKLFGKYDTCVVPTEENQKSFVTMEELT